MLSRSSRPTRLPASPSCRVARFQSATVTQRVERSHPDGLQPLLWNARLPDPPTECAEVSAAYTSCADRTYLACDCRCPAFVIVAAEKAPVIIERAGVDCQVIPAAFAHHFAVVND